MLNYWSIPIVFMWYLRHGDYNIYFSTKNCCSNVSMERTELRTLVIILDLTHLSAWEDLPLIWKHKYYLLEGGNLDVVYNWTDGIGGVAFNIVKWVGVYVAWKLELFLWCYTGLDVIYIWGVVLFLIGSNVFTIKSRQDRCSRGINCRWCMRSWRW